MDAYPLGRIPDRVLRELGKQIVHRLGIGHGDISGEDAGTVFADAVGGLHRSKPIGLSDVELNGTAWSVKTVKVDRPFDARRVRLISGRNSPDYSFGISNPRANAEHTGRAVLSIWNKRVNEGMDEHADLRIAVLVRDMARREFVLFEEPAMRFVPDNYGWQFNKNGNMEGFNRDTGEHCFTWQPHGGQFTILRTVPASARRFSIGPRVPLVEVHQVLAYVGYREDWIQIHG